MGSRLKSLDGIRGFAALAVFLSHIGFNIAAITSSQLLITSYKTLAVGPNSVQILFVLCGFLMAYLYPRISSPVKFIRKRYARIFPVYIVVVIFLWITLLEKKFTNEYQQPLLLLFLGLSVYVSWNAVRKIDARNIVGRVLFFLFISLQLLLVIFNIFITPRFISQSQLTFPKEIGNLVIALSNITLTTSFIPLITEINRLSVVFWSLLPEVLFYLVYPFFVLPIITIGKKKGTVVSILLIFAITKILFDLDNVMLSFLGFQGINIARASGFVAGVVIGTIYQNKSMLWRKIELVGSKPWISFLALILFIGIQWGDGAIRDGKSIDFMNLYYLVSSWIIAILILVAIIPNTIVNKVFSSKILGFIGLISYSLYLIHIHVIDWVNQLLQPTTTPLILLHLGVVLVLTLSVAYFLFRCIESLYFMSKLHTKQHAQSVQENDTNCYLSFKKGGIAFFVIFLICFYLYSSKYSPTQTVYRYPLTSFFQLPQEISLTDTPFKTSFTAHDNTLSAVEMNLRYNGNAEYTRTHIQNPAQLVFRLYDSENNLVFESTRSAYQVEGQPRFPFGFPTILYSNEKRYTLEILVTNAREIDSVFVPQQQDLITIHTNTKSEVLQNLFSHTLNRIIFVLSNINAVFLLLFSLYILSQITRQNPRK